jgi:hypothetical protein
MNKIIVALKSVNSSVFTTTMHTVLNIAMFCKARNLQLELIISNDTPDIKKLLKLCDKLLYIDYGVSFQRDTVIRLLDTFPENIKVMIAPVVLPEINWESFKVKTRMCSEEPVEQRGLSFDTHVSMNREILPGVSEYLKGGGRVVSYDSKAVLKKMKSSVQLGDLKEVGIKIGVLNSDTITCHYQYECIGNILETSGLKVVNGPV